MTTTMIFMPIAETQHGEPVPDAVIDQISISGDIRMTDVVIDLGSPDEPHGTAPGNVTIEREGSNWVVRVYAAEREEPVTVTRINASTGEPA